MLGGLPVVSGSSGHRLLLLHVHVDLAAILPLGPIHIHIGTRHTTVSRHRTQVRNIKLHIRIEPGNHLFPATTEAGGKVEAVDIPLSCRVVDGENPGDCGG